MSTYSPLLLLPLLSSSLVRADIDLRASVFHTDLINVSQVRLTGDNFIHVGMILTNVLGKTKHFQNNLTVEFQMFDKKSKMLTQFERMLQSLFLYSRGTPLHFIFITDEESLPTIENTIKQEIGRYLSESVINKTPVKNQKTIFKFPKLRVEFVDIHSITSAHREDIERLKEYYGHHAPPGTVYRPKGKDGPAMVPTFKYTLDLFYILPFYHTDFPPQLDRIIFLDSDLVFRSDLIQLYSHFKKFSAQQVIGVATDQTPHYFDKSKSFRENHPSSSVGSPGRMQGFNTGVALFDLGKMRSSKLYQEATEVSEMIRLEKKYQISGTVGDQDWLTLLGWEDTEDLFYLLPCQFNRQTDQTYNTDYWRDLFSVYHHCDNTAFIIHNNGE